MPLSPPPLDHNGVVEPHDHEEILNDDDIVRRISAHHLVVDSGGVRRISSMAFKPSTGPKGGMSIDIKKSIEMAGLNPVQFVTTPVWIGSVIFKAGVPRAHGLLVGFEPIAGNDHHGEVWGKFRSGTGKAIQRASQWFVAIPDTVII